MIYARHRLILLLIVGIVAGIIGLYRHTSPENNSTSANNPTSTPVPSVMYLDESQIPPMTVEQILSGADVIDNKLLDPGKLRTIVATGDVIPARGVDAKIRKYGASYPFAGEGITQVLQSGDLAIANLESPLIANCPNHDEGFTFCGQPAFAKAMADAGIGLVTLENNHINNYGESGIQETIEYLQQAGISYARSNHLAISTIRGLRIGVLAFTGIGGQFYPETIRKSISDARPRVDLLIVAFHWGKEYELIPTPDPNIAPDDPRLIANLAIEAGADMIIGNHPHWVQGIEMINGKLVNYAYGNFIFDQSWSAETMQGYIGSYTFYGTKLVNVKMHPIIIVNQAQPTKPTTQLSQKIIHQIRESSFKLIEKSK